MNTCTQKRNKLYAIFVLTIAIFASVAVGFLTPSNVYADTYPAANAQYHYFENARAICEGGGKLYIADGNKIYQYAESGAQKITEEPLFTTRGAVEQMVFSADRLFVLEDDTANPDPSQHKIRTINIYSLPDGSRTAINFGGNYDEGYTAIAVLGGSLYAAHDLQWIHKFSTLSPVHTGTVLRATRPIRALVAGSNELFYAITTATDNHEIWRFAATGTTSERATQVGNTRVPFSTMVYANNQLSVFTNEQVFNYRTVNQPFTQNGSTLARPQNIRAVTAGSNGNYYTIGYDRSISKYSSFQSAPEMLIASCSPQWGFYDTPMDIASRNGRVLVADANNERISIRNGNLYDGITDLPNPSSVATDTDGYVYFSYYDFGLSKIAKYEYIDGELSPIADFEFRPNYVSNIPIRLLRADSFGTVYVMAEQNGKTMLYRLSAEKVDAKSGYEFEQVSGVGDAKIYGMAAGLNRPGFFVALDSSTADNIEIFKLTETGKISTGIHYLAKDFIDMAVDADGGVYLLVKSDAGYMLVRYDYDATTKTYQLNAYNGNAGGYVFPAGTGSIDSNPVRISVSAIDETPNYATAYRDILIADAGRHTVTRLSLQTAFGIVPEKTPLEPKDLVTPIDAQEQILREVTNDCPVFARGTDVYPLMRRAAGNEIMEEPVMFKQGLRIIVEKLDDESDYSLVIADNVDYAGGVLIGYIRNHFISEPFEYEEPDEADKMQVVSGERTFIYRYPLVYLPAQLTLERGKTAPPMEKLSFVYLVETVIETPEGEEETRMEYGYTDNYGNEWFRVRYGELATEIGYVLADTVDPPGALPSPGINKNARIVLDMNYPGQEYAPVFIQNNSGQMVEDLTLSTALPIGIKVQVLSLPFDSSREYTLILLTHNGATYERYVRTTNISFEGIDILKVIAVSVILITLTIMGLVIGRYLRVKKQSLPKNPVVNYI